MSARRKRVGQDEDHSVFGLLVDRISIFVLVVFWFVLAAGFALLVGRQSPFDTSLFKDTVGGATWDAKHGRHLVAANATSP